MPRVFLKAREPFSSYSHFVGAVLSGVGLFAMLIRMLTIDTANDNMSRSFQWVQQPWPWEPQRKGGCR